MKDAMRMVKEFHEKFGCYSAKKPGFPPSKIQDLRDCLLEEEHIEYQEAVKAKNLVEVADGLADMVYIICGTALAYGIPLAEVFEEVHKTNMAKMPDNRRGDGKIMKPPDWKAPDIERILNEAQKHKCNFKIQMDKLVCEVCGKIL